MEIKTIPITYLNGILLTKVIIEGKSKRHEIHCAIDTGCATTCIKTEVVDSLGYSARDGEEISAVASTTGREEGYTLKIKQFNWGPLQLYNCLVEASDMSGIANIQCLIGNNFLDLFKVEIDYQKQILTLSSSSE
jgi:predicted aspartyl protease